MKWVFSVSEMGKIKIFTKKFWWAFKDKYFYFLFFLVAAILVIFLYFVLNLGIIDYIDLVRGFGTFIVAIVIFLQNFIRNWEDRLPKRLNVEYVFRNRAILKCENSVLSGESEIRQLSQQVGSQMIGGALLKFDLNMKIKEMSIDYWCKGATCVKPYFVSINLTDFPDFKLNIDVEKDTVKKFLKALFLDFGATKKWIYDVEASKKIVEWKREGKVFFRLLKSSNGEESIEREDSKIIDEIVKLFLEFSKKSTEVEARKAVFYILKN